LLKEFKEVFAWSYEDMPGIDIDSATLHSNRLNHEASLAKAKRDEAKMDF